MWADDANDRAIPIIPAQRVPAEVPACCGRQMERDRGQWVCRKCRGYYHPLEGEMTALHDTDAGRHTTGPRAETTHGDVARVSRLRRAARFLTRRPSAGAQSWQCSQCGRWFDSDRPAQVCPDCS